MTSSPPPGPSTQQPDPTGDAGAPSCDAEGFTLQPDEPFETNMLRPEFKHEWINNILYVFDRTTGLYARAVPCVHPEETNFRVELHREADYPRSPEFIRETVEPDLGAALVTSYNLLIEGAG